MYEVKVITDFAAAHSLRDYPGPCRNIHGHNWKVEVTLQARELDEMGLAMDFRDIRKETEALLDQLDHAYLNEHPPFHTLNPTAENIARYLFEQLSKRLDGDRVRVVRVTVWETERACASFFDPSR